MPTDINVTPNDNKPHDIRHQLGNYSDDVLLTDVELGLIANLNPRTLRNQRCRKRSIFPFVKLPNGSVRYPVSGVRATLAAIKKNAYAE